jgi:predicted nuclease of predicted toxin-antitoxin system
MRFVLDEDVDAKAVGSFLRQRGHECWTVVEARLGGADDDTVSIYADDRGAILITHDAEATRRRRKFTFGRHVFLRCHQLEAVDLLEAHLPEVERRVERHETGVIEVRESGVTYHPPRYETD